MHDATYSTFSGEMYNPDSPDNGRTFYLYPTASGNGINWQIATSSNASFIDSYWVLALSSARMFNNEDAFESMNAGGLYSQSISPVQLDANGMPV